jgi:hypothetical protein
MNVFQCVSMMRSACCIWCASPVTCPSVVFAHLPSGILAPAPGRVMPRCYKAIQDKMTTLSLHWVYTVPPLMLNSGVMLNCSIYRVSTANQKAWRSLTRQACCKSDPSSQMSRSRHKQSRLETKFFEKTRDNTWYLCNSLCNNALESSSICVCVGFAAVLSCLLTLLMLLT